MATPEITISELRDELLLVINRLRVQAEKDHKTDSVYVGQRQGIINTCRMIEDALKALTS